MTPIEQTILNLKNGDCMRACMASIFELPLKKVTNFMKAGPDKFSFHLDAWLNKRGLHSFDLTWDSPEDVEWGVVLKDTYVISCGDSPRGKNGEQHACVYYNGKMVHDPWPGGCGYEKDPVKFTVITVQNPANVLLEVKP